MLGIYGSYYSQAQEALDKLNEIRKEACEAGNIPDPRDPSRMLTSLASVRQRLAFRLISWHPDMIVPAIKILFPYPFMVYLPIVKISLTVGEKA